MANAVDREIGGLGTNTQGHKIFTLTVTASDLGSQPLTYRRKPTTEASMILISALISVYMRIFHYPAGYDYPVEPYTRKNAQVVINLQQTCSNSVPTTCQQDVFTLLVPSLLTSCQRLVRNVCQRLVELNRLVTSCIVIVLQFNNLSTTCE